MHKRPVCQISLKVNQYLNQSVVNWWGALESLILALAPGFILPYLST